MEKIRYVLLELSKELFHCNKANTKLRELLQERCQRYDGMPCELSEIRHVPSESDIKGYRNKCEFTIGLYFANLLSNIRNTICFMSFTNVKTTPTVVVQ